MQHGQLPFPAPHSSSFVSLRISVSCGYPNCAFAPTTPQRVALASPPTAGNKLLLLLRLFIFRHLFLLLPLLTCTFTSEPICSLMNISVAQFCVAYTCFPKVVACSVSLGKSKADLLLQCQDLGGINPAHICGRQAGHAFEQADLPDLLLSCHPSDCTSGQRGLARQALLGSQHADSV